MYGTTSPKQEKQQSKGNFINIINLPNQHQSTQSTSYARHQSTKDCPVAILAPSISSSAQLNLQRCLQDLMAIFQSTTSLLRGLEYGLYWFMNQFLFLRDILSFWENVILNSEHHSLKILLVTSNKDMQNDNHAGDTATRAITNTINRNIDSWKVCFFFPTLNWSPPNSKERKLWPWHWPNLHMKCVIMFGSIRN